MKKLLRRINTYLEESRDWAINSLEPRKEDRIQALTVSELFFSKLDDKTQKFVYDVTANILGDGTLSWKIWDSKNNTIALEGIASGIEDWESIKTKASKIYGTL